MKNVTFIPRKNELRPASTQLGLWIGLEAKEGKAEELIILLQESRAIVIGEPATSTWFAVRLGPTSFAIFDTFPDEESRNAHLAGKTTSPLISQAASLLARSPTFEKFEVLAATF